jgi:hypothetical protein
MGTRLLTIKNKSDVFKFAKNKDTKELKGSSNLKIKSAFLGFECCLGLAHTFIAHVVCAIK